MLRLFIHHVAVKIFLKKENRKKLNINKELIEQIIWYINTLEYYMAGKNYE